MQLGGAVVRRKSCNGMFACVPRDDCTRATSFNGGWRADLIVPAAGALPLGRCSCGLRRSAPDAACAGRSNKSGATTLDAWCRRAPACACATPPSFCHCCAADDDDRSLYRGGTSEGPTFASRLPPPATMAPSRLTFNVLHRCTGATIGYRTTFFGSTARAPTNPPRELPHIFLTALARFARWPMDRRLRVLPRRARAQRRHDHHDQHLAVRVTRRHSISPVTPKF